MQIHRSTSNERIHHEIYFVMLWGDTPGYYVLSYVDDEAIGALYAFGKKELAEELAEFERGVTPQEGVSL